MAGLLGLLGGVLAGWDSWLDVFAASLGMLAGRLGLLAGNAGMVGLLAGWLAVLPVSLYLLLAG
jgi:hypothetical protein